MHDGLYPPSTWSDEALHRRLARKSQRVQEIEAERVELLDQMEDIQDELRHREGGTE